MKRKPKDGDCNRVKQTKQSAEANSKLAQLKRDPTESTRRVIATEFNREIKCGNKFKTSSIEKRVYRDHKEGDSNGVKTEKANF